MKSIRISEDNWKRLMQMKLTKNLKTLDDAINELFETFLLEEKVAGKA